MTSKVIHRLAGAYRMDSRDALQVSLKAALTFLQLADEDNGLKRC